MQTTYKITGQSLRSGLFKESVNSELRIDEGPWHIFVTAQLELNDVTTVSNIASVYQTNQEVALSITVDPVISKESRVSCAAKGDFSFIGNMIPVIKNCLQIEDVYEIQTIKIALWGWARNGEKMKISEHINLAKPRYLYSHFTNPSAFAFKVRKLFGVDENKFPQVANSGADQ